MSRIVYRKALENCEQQDLPLHRRHFSERFLETATHTLAFAMFVERAERLLQPMKKRENADLGIFGLADQIGLLQHYLGAKPNPFVAAFL
jgi:hypothetical protein